MAIIGELFNTPAGVLELLDIENIQDQQIYYFKHEDGVKSFHWSEVDYHYPKVVDDQASYLRKIMKGKNEGTI